MKSGAPLAFHDDFRDGRYLIESTKVSNLLNTYYFKTPNLTTEGFNGLILSSNRGYIDYDFNLNGLRSARIIPIVTNMKGCKFMLLNGDNYSNVLLELNNANIHSSDGILIDHSLANGHARLRMHLEAISPAKTGECKAMILGLSIIDRSIALTDLYVNSSKAETQSLNSMTSNTSFISRLQEKNSNWRVFALEDAGWNQTNEGYLARIPGEENPELVFKFLIPSFATTTEIEALIHSHNKNPIAVFYSFDNLHWESIATPEDSFLKFKTKTEGNSAIFVKFIIPFANLKSQIRDFKINFIK